MKILLAHNFYREPGGEDEVFHREQDLLLRKGHEVVTYIRSNRESDSFNALQKLIQIRNIVSDPNSRREIEALLQAEKPDVVHIHNTFTMISPSIYEACQTARIPVVQTLHNYRLLCPAVTFYRDGHICEDCLTDGLAASVLHGCYRKSRLTTAAVAAMIKVHRIRNTWNRDIDAYIALTEFSRDKFVENGLPSEKVFVKPNFVDPDPGVRQEAGNYALFVGRLTQEKGVSTLLQAWKDAGLRIPLKIVGDGQERNRLQEFARTHSLDQVEFLDQLDRDGTFKMMRGARFLIVPSLWYEGSPLVITESFACGVPVLASGIGAMKELIADKVTGLHFAAGDPRDLAETVAWACNHPEEMERMGSRARRVYEAKFAPDSNYRALTEIYEAVIKAKSSKDHVLHPA